MFVTEVWHNGRLEISIDELPDALEFVSNPLLRSWFAELSVSPKWRRFCEVFDEKYHDSGCLPFDGRTIRVSKRNYNVEV